MIVPKTSFDCTCAHCGHDWSTRSENIPRSCPKCKRVTWNEDHDPTLEKKVVIRESRFAKPAPKIEKSPELDAIIDDVQNVWVDDGQKFDEARGEMWIIEKNILTGVRRKKELVGDSIA